MHESNHMKSFHQNLLSVLALLLFLIPIISCQQKSVPEVPISRPDLAELAFNLVNRQRALQQLYALSWEPSVAETALEHSLNMAEGKVVFGHDGFADRVAFLRTRLTFGNAGENIGYVTGYENPVEEIVSRWMQNSEHRDNILGAFHLSGIGVASGPDGEIFITQIFLKIN